MVREGVEKELYYAASKGDLAKFQQLLKGDPYLLDGVSFAGSRNLLHIATIWGELSIVEEILKIHKQLAKELDSQKSSPLHIAAAKGHAKIASKLLDAAAHMCWSRDCHGMNPIHIAAMNGHVQILEDMIKSDRFRPAMDGDVETFKSGRFAAMEKVDRGQTVLHLCVKHGQLKALQFLADKLGDLVHSNNDDGETILHLAARYEEVEMLRWLADNTKIDKEAKESRGRRAVEILKDCSSDSSSYSDIIEVLRGGNDELAMDIIEVLTGGNDELAMEKVMALDKMTETLMVVAVLIVAMVFQATISPPGGVWQEDSSTHKAGEAVMATTHPGTYKNFMYSNTVAFIFSCGTIILLITRRSIRSPGLFYSILFTVIVSLIFVAISYQSSVKAITPNEVKSVANGGKISILLFICVFSLFLFSAMVRSWFRRISSKIISLIPNRNGDHIQL